MEGLQINDKRPAPAPPGTDDGKFSFGEVFDYIQHGRYPEGVSKSDKNTLRRRAKFFRVNDKDLYYIGYIQMQGGASDCALFAIAFAVTLSEGDDPHKSSFNQQLMRSHLMECFENGDITKFPPSIKPRRCTSSIKSSKTVQLYCTCRLPWDKEFNIHGSLAQCAQCKNWYHKNCLTIPSAAFIEHTFIWFCTFCSTHRNSGLLLYNS